MGRQPILNGLEEVVGYELLFRSPGSLSSAVLDSQVRATSIVILNILSAIGIREALGEHMGFVNVDAELLMNDAIELLPSDIIGLELLEDINFTPEIIERCRELKAKGFVLALDDHRYSPDFNELYEGIVDIVKIDLILTPLDEIYNDIESLKKFPVKLLAEKVDSRHVYLRSRRMGFELFQGYFFSRPTLVQKTRMANSSAVFFKLMQQLAHDAEIDDIEVTIKQSPPLTYKLLLLVNSVSFSTREKVRTIRNALTMIGMEHLRRWVQLAIFADDGGQGMNHPLLEMAAVRAAFMEEVARLDLSNTRLLRHADPDSCFMVGTLSVLKDVYEISVDEMLENLNLSDDIQAALLSRSGDIGTLLCLAEMMEKLEFDEAISCLERLGVSTEDVLECQSKAYCWRSKLF